MPDIKRFALILYCLLSFVGCSGTSQPGTSQPVDDAPFREAIGQYLQANNMAMKIKEIKQGPVVTNDQAELQASLTHEQLGGPAVTWDFEFAKQTDGTWRVVKHQD